MPYFDFRGAQMYYNDLDEREDKSKGLTIVFVHGAGSSRIIWALQLIELRRQHRVIALDLYGHGESQKLEDPPDVICGFPEQVAALVKHLGLEEFVLAGHSMGGGVVMSYVLNKDFPQPQAIILADTSANLDLRKLIVGLVIEVLEDHSPLEDYSQLESDLETYILPDYRKIAGAFDKSILKDLDACDDFNVEDRLGEITLPTLVLVGEDDDIIKPKVAKKLAESIPNAQFGIIPGGDHSPMIEVYESFNRRLKEFLTFLEKGN